MDRKKALIVWCFIALAFLVFELFSFGYQIGDENNYYYMANVMKQGEMPYRDFFFAHPPLQLIPLVLFSFFGIMAMKFTSVLFALITGYLVFLVLAEKGEKEAVIGSLLFFTSYEILFHSLNPVGQDITALFLTLGIYLYFKKKDLWAGICFGLAALSGLYALIIIATALAYIFIKKEGYAHSIPKSKFNQETATGASRGDVAKHSERDARDGVSKHSLRERSSPDKPSENFEDAMHMQERMRFYRILAGFAAIFGTINLILILAFGMKYLQPVYIFQMIRPGAGSSFLVLGEFVKLNMLLIIGFLLYFFLKPRKSILIYIISVYLLYLVFSPSIFLHYYYLLVPLMAIAGGYSITAFLNKDKKFFFLFMILLVILGFFASEKASSNSRTAQFASAQDIADEIGQGKTLFGTDASLVALLNNGHIPTYYIDSNLQRFKSGLANVSDIIAILNSTETYVITGEIYQEKMRIKRGLLDYKEYDDFLKNDCEKVNKTFDNYHWVYVCG